MKTQLIIQLTIKGLQTKIPANSLHKSIQNINPIQKEYVYNLKLDCSQLIQLKII